MRLLSLDFYSTTRIRNASAIVHEKNHWYSAESGRQNRSYRSGAQSRVSIMVGSFLNPSINFAKSGDFAQLGAVELVIHDKFPSFARYFLFNQAVFVVIHIAVAQFV